MAVLRDSLTVNRITLQLARLTMAQPPHVCSVWLSNELKCSILYKVESNQSIDEWTENNFFYLYICVM